MADQAFISICIPAYKRTQYLIRLLDSIAVQRFRQFEVIVSDDSPGDGVESLCRSFEGKFPIRYHRNAEALGSPENWNAAIRRASGKWIKLMHDDDWFTDPGSLEAFAAAAEASPETRFIFSAYHNIHLTTQAHATIHPSPWRWRAVRRHPVNLMAQNIIGPPSTVLHLNDQTTFYDTRLKWLVDIDFYIRCLRQTSPVLIDKPLVCIGISDEQISFDCFRQRPVEIPENFLLLNKAGPDSLRQIWVYDAFWRLLRNLEIRTAHELEESGNDAPVPRVILSMIRWQAGVPKSTLKIGWISKLLMGSHYILHRLSIP